MWWKSAVNRSFLLCFAACRTRSSACDTLSRFCARRVLCWPAFPSVPPFAPPAPPSVARHCSQASSLLWQDQTSRGRASSASAPRLPDADQSRHAALVSHETSRFPNKECLHMPGSPTTPGRRGACDSAPRRVAFRVSDGVGSRNIVLFVAQWLACALPCQRFTYGLTTARA